MMGLINIAMIVWLLGVVALQSILGEVFIRDAENEFVAVETFSNNVNWFAPFYTGGGYSSEAISFVKALDKVGVKNFTITQHGDSWNQDFVEGQEESERRLLAKYEMLLKTVGYPRISICHSEPGAWYTPTPNYHTSRCPNTFPHKDGHLSYYKVGRTMFETDRLPSGWLPRLQYMDELWVPTEHMRQIFLQHDVPAEKLHVIEEAVDTDLYQPLPRRHVHYEKYQLQALRRLPENFFVFLFVGKFEARKGMDILLEAYLKEFHKPEDNVVLVLLTGAYHSSPQDFEGQIQRMLREKKVDSTAFSPNYIVLSQVQANAMPVLYSFADALVVPSHGEGWGRPHMEAMACGTPVIATNWSGPTAFINESTGYLLEIEDALVDAPGWKGHKWAQPKVSHLQQLMRHVYTHRDEVREKGRLARAAMVEKYSLEVQGQKLLQEFTRMLTKIGVLASTKGGSSESESGHIALSADATILNSQPLGKQENSTEAIFDTVKKVTHSNTEQLSGDLETVSPDLVDATDPTGDSYHSSEGLPEEVVGEVQESVPSVSSPIIESAEQMVDVAIAEDNFSSTLDDL